MASNRAVHRVIVLTEGERIEGTLSHVEGIRLSDFFNAPGHQEAPFLIIQHARVLCRQSKEEMVDVPLVLVARNRIVAVMTPPARAHSES